MSNSAPTSQEVAGPQNNGVKNREGFLDRIRSLIQYYFSDENLPNDNFLKKQIQLDSNNQGYVPLEFISQFNRVKQLNASVDNIREALKGSTMVALSADGNSLRRSSPILSNDNDSSKRTVYVSKIPKECNKEALRLLFSKFGNVLRVDVPVDKKTGEHKGIAFVEFSSEDEYQVAMKSTGHSFTLKPFTSKRNSTDNNKTEKKKKNKKKEKKIGQR